MDREVTRSDSIGHYNKIAKDVEEELYPPAFFNSGYIGIDEEVDSYNKELRKHCNLYIHLIDSYNINTDHKDLLEVGCGFGRGCFFLKKRYNFSSVVGCDINSNLLSVANQLFTKTRFVVGDINNLQQLNEQFDIVITIETGYYWNSNISQSFESVVKPGGDLLIATDVKRNNNIQLNGFKLVGEKDITDNVLLSLNENILYQRAYAKRIKRLETNCRYISQHYIREQK